MKFGYFAEFEQTLKTSSHVSEMYQDYIEQVCLRGATRLRVGVGSGASLHRDIFLLFGPGDFARDPRGSNQHNAYRARRVFVALSQSGDGGGTLRHLDVLSGGRLEFRIGRGVANFEWNKFRNEGYEQSRDIMYEALELILKCWTQNSVVHNGRYYTVKEPINVIPKPIQKPHPENSRRRHQSGISRTVRLVGLERIGNLQLLSKHRNCASGALI